MKYSIKPVFILAFMIIILYTLFPMTTFAKTKEVDVIKVGYYEDGDYMTRNQQNEYIGYNIEYLQEIAKQSGLQFEIIDTGSWNAAYDMLVSGEIDLLPAVYFSEKRAGEVLFSEQPMCSIYTTLNVRTDDDRYDYEDFDAFEAMKVGIIKGGIDGEHFKKFCQEHKISLDIIDYDETGHLLAALDNGTLDGIAITHLGKNSSYRSVAQFSPSPLYFTVSKKNPQLLEDLNRAMNIILLNNPGYSRDLYDKYLSPSSNQKPVFTKEERQYIEESKPIVVSYDPDFAPLSYKDEDSGEFKGTVADIFSFIEKNSGLKFEFKANSQSKALEFLKEGKIDALCLSDGDYLWDSRNQINSTLYYLSTPTSVITQDETTKRDVIALPDGYQLSEIVSKDYPDSTIRKYSSVSQCLNAVIQGDADAAYLSTQVAGFFLDSALYNELNETTLSKYVNNFCIGISSTADSELFSILNKCVKYLPAEQTDAFMIKNSIGAKDVSLIEFAERYVWLVLLVLGVILLLISYNLHKTLRSNRRIQELLYRDPLTLLNNMDGFCKKWLDITNPDKKHNFALIYGDISHFKLINDTFGFSIGNDVLLAAGRILSEELREEEFCGRLSADNFVLLMQYDTWETLTNRLNSCIAKLNQWRREKTELNYEIDMVFGVYLTNQTEEHDIHQMMDLANYARRHAKHIPGHFAVLYDEEMQKEALSIKHLETSLDQALAENEFEVYYQPKVLMENENIIGSEALIRWNHPEKGFLTPGYFIPLLEKNGMITRVDFWLFENVCRTMHSWDEQGIPLLPVSCNFSRLHFKNPEFPQQICGIVDRHQISHHLIEIEITESALMEDSEIIAAKLFQLKNLGFQIAIDDFGSGYSSLGQLQQLTADVLKLDRSFVNHASTGSREQIVLKNIIHMAEELGMTVICEGIETLPQAELLKSLGCRFAQGFYFYRPMPLKDYQKLI